MAASAGEGGGGGLEGGKLIIEERANLKNKNKGTERERRTERGRQREAFLPLTCC